MLCRGGMGSVSLNFGIAFFFGKLQFSPMGISGISSLGGNRGGKHAYENGSYPFLGIVRERDEIFMRIRYTF